MYNGEDFLAMGRKAQTPAREGIRITVEDEAQGLARRIRTTSGGERLFNIGQIEAEIKILERNVENGYGAGWGFRLAVLRRVVELVGSY